MAPSLPVQAVDATIRVIEPYQRADLERRLRQAKARLLDGRVRVLVVGEFKQGKSFLVDCLVGALVCPVHDDVATPVPTVVRYDTAPSLTLVPAAGRGGPRHQKKIEQRGLRMHDIGRAVARAMDSREQFSQIEVGLPVPLLADGLEIVDTPGVGGLNSVHGAATMAALPSADAVLLVSDASQEYTAPELAFVRQAIAVCPNVACVLTKIDLYPEWRRIREIDLGHLRAANIDTEVFAVSSAVRWQAMAEHRPDLDAESGVPALLRFLQQRVIGQADGLARRSTVHDILAVTGQIVGGLSAERAARENPAAIQDLIRELNESKNRSAALKERSARWQQTLTDGVADLNADVEHDLRERMRDIRREAEDEIDGSGDPTGTWEQLAQWVEQRVAAAASANFLWAAQRADWLARRVAEHFAADREEALPALHTAASAALDSLRAMTIRDEERWNLGQKALTGLRGSYMGVLMFGLLGTFIGMSLINPLSVGAGLLMGGKAISDERKRIVARRQHEARQAVRRYIDDATFQVGKDSRDYLRQVQRQLRDHFVDYAEQQSRSLRESLQAAERSVQSSTADRGRRLEEIDKELAQLAELERRVRELLPRAERRALPGSAPKQLAG